MLTSTHTHTITHHWLPAESGCEGWIKRKKHQIRSEKRPVVSQSHQSFTKPINKQDELEGDTQLCQAGSSSHGMYSLTNKHNYSKGLALHIVLDSVWGGSCEEDLGGFFFFFFVKSQTKLLSPRGVKHFPAKSETKIHFETVPQSKEGRSFNLCLN